VAAVGQDDIGSNDVRNLITILSGNIHQLGRFSGIQVARNPRGLFAFYAELVEQIARLHNLEQPMPETFEFVRKRRADQKRLRREQPLLLSEQSLLGKSF